MKRYLCAAVLSLLALAAPLTVLTEKAGGADGEGPGQKAQVTLPALERRLLYLTDMLALTAGQQALIKSILLSEADRGREIREESPLGRQEKEEKLAALLRAVRSQIGQALTPEQQIKYEALFERAAQRLNKKQPTTSLPEHGSSPSPS